MSKFPNQNSHSYSDYFKKIQDLTYWHFDIPIGDPGFD